MVLVDTSIWIDFLRKGAAPRWRPVLAEHVAAGEACLVAPVVAELMYGARGDREQEAIQQLAGVARLLPLDDAAWFEAGRVGRAWRSRGRTLALIDCLLAGVANRQDLPLWTGGRDFDPLFEAGEIQRYVPRIH